MTNTTARSGGNTDLTLEEAHFRARLTDRERLADRATRYYLLVAGGIGITPLLAMADELDRTGRPWTLVYGGRTRSSMATPTGSPRSGRTCGCGPRTRTG